MLFRNLEPSVANAIDYKDLSLLPNYTLCVIRRNKMMMGAERLEVVINNLETIRDLDIE